MLISFLTDGRVRRYFAFKYRFVAGFIIFHLSDDNNIYLIGIFVNVLKSLFDNMQEICYTCNRTGNE